jgi:hypothetical protein
MTKAGIQPNEKSGPSQEKIRIFSKLAAGQAAISSAHTPLQAADACRLLFFLGCEKRSTMEGLVPASL